MLNHDSSRSHLFLVFTFLTTIEGEPPVKTKLTLVDLAGSERIKRSFAEGQQKLEAIQINKSLSALGDVFSALTSGKRREGKGREREYLALQEQNHLDHIPN